MHQVLWIFNIFRKRDLKVMALRIIQMRVSLKSHFDKLGTPGNWDHVMTQIGMFCYSGLKRKEKKQLNM